MTLDATVAGSAANSYLTVEAADLLAGERLGLVPAVWSALSTEDKEKALISATADIDAYVRVGARHTAGQMLSFPRVTDVDTLDAPFIPLSVQRATFEQAAYLADNAATMDRASTRRARGLISFSEENVSGSLSEDPLFGQLCPRAQTLLQSITVTRRGFTGTLVVGSGTVAAYESETNS